LGHPLNYEESSGAFQSCIPRCVHSVFRCWDDPSGKSSSCELCNSGCKPKPMLSEKQLAKQKARLEKIAPQIEEEFIETIVEDEDNQESNAESDFEVEENTEAYREEAEIEVTGD
jgi:hypothetical protein